MRANFRNFHTVNQFDVNVKNSINFTKKQDLICLTISLLLEDKFTKEFVLNFTGAGKSAYLENHVKIDFTKKATQISRFLTHHLLILAKVDYDLSFAS